MAKGGRRRPGGGFRNRLRQAGRNIRQGAANLRAAFQRRRRPQAAGR